MSTKFETFCDHVANGRLAIVQEMLESGEVLFEGNEPVALFSAVKNGHVEIVDYFLQNATLAPSDHGNFAIGMAAERGHLAVVDRLLQDERVDPSVHDNYAFQQAAERGHLAVVERLLQVACVDPAANGNHAVRWAAGNGHLAVVERLLQDVRVDPAAYDNCAVKGAAEDGHLAVVDRLLQDERVDPSAEGNEAVRWAAHFGHLAVVDRLLEDDRVDFTVAIQHSRPEHRKRFECRERLTEICVALQAMELPAWVTVQILKAVRPWSTLPLHSKWNLVCAVKHFHDSINTPSSSGWCTCRGTSLKFEFCLLCSQRLCADCHFCASFAAVAEAVLQCKTTKGVVEIGVKHDADVVSVSR
jgi:hypothetical protein